MSFRPKKTMRHALIAGTAVSLLGVVSTLVDREAHGQLWQRVGARLENETARLAPVVLPAAERAVTAFRREFTELTGLRMAASASAAIEPPHIIAASMTAIGTPFQEAEPERQDVNRGTKGDRLVLAELSVPKLIMPEPEPLAEGASAALFLLSPSIPEPAPAAVVATSDPDSTVKLAAGPLAASMRAPFVHPPAKNPFVTSAASAASLPNPSKITWTDLVRMASMKGGDGEEPSKIFGALSEKEFRAREVRCMATAIYFEARGEPVRGQVAVGQVIMNRVRSDFYPNTICGVVFQGQWNRNACQFSFACDGRTDAAKEPEQWKIAIDVAKQVISGKVYLSDIGDATHYHAVYVRPDWRRNVRRIKQLGVHIFYKAPFVKPLASDPDYQAL
jgi:spore germination cell wall hydrolase CwlJ-like protein